MPNPCDQAEGLRRILMPVKPNAICNLSVNLKQGKGQLLHSLIQDMHKQQIHFIDTSIGGHQELPLALLNYHHFIMKLTHTPESIKQTFGIIKLFSNSTENRVFGMIVSAQNEAAAQTIYRNLKQASKRFTHIQLELIGFSTLDNNWVSPMLKSMVPAQMKKTIFTTPFGAATN